ncbi:MAG: MGMT family protein [Candidatus Omnitrophota bacterium]
MPKKNNNIESLSRDFNDFQRKVYKVVLSIPIGQVRSYSWVAREIGKPKAVRAVGTALRNNPFAPIIPCHRVVKNNGSLGGYNRGLEKKKDLIELEKTLVKLKILNK